MTDLGIGEVTGTPLPDHLVFVVFLQVTHRARSTNQPNDSNSLQSNTDRKSTIKNIILLNIENNLLLKIYLLYIYDNFYNKIYIYDRFTICNKIYFTICL